MGLVIEYMDVKITNKTLNHYKSYGYNCQIGETIKVLTNHLSKGTHQKVRVICDYCGKEYYMPFYSYFQKVSKNNKVACDKCRYLKMAECNYSKYGYNFPFESDIVQNKVKDTISEKYGVDYIGSLKIIQNKINNTIYKKYKVKNIMSCDEIYNKQRKTMIEKYGIDRIAINTSKQQIKICKILGAEINYKFKRYVIDGYLHNFNIAIEYDGKGHDLTVRLNKMSKEDFIKKENNRQNEIIKEMKLLRIISKTDKLPEDDKLNEILNNLILEINSKSLNLLCYDLDSQKVILSI